MSNNIVVTGASGFTGYYVKQVFSQAGFNIIALTRNVKYQHERYCDLTNKNSIITALKGLTFKGIIHLAALSYVASTDSSKFYLVNTIGTTNLLETMDNLNLNPEKVIIASSANVYGNAKEERICEDHQFNPQNHYAASKVAMELLCYNWFERFPILITRPFNYTGVKQNPNFIVPKLIKAFAQQDQTINLGNVTIERDFSDVKDIAKCYLELFRCENSSDTVNLCTGRTITLLSIVNKLQQLAGYTININIEQRLKRKMEIISLCGSNDKLLKIINFTPKWNFEHTLEEMLIHEKGESSLKSLESI